MEDPPVHLLFWLLSTLPFLKWRTARSSKARPCGERPHSTPNGTRLYPRHRDHEVFFSATPGTVILDFLLRDVTLLSTSIARSQEARGLYGPRHQGQATLLSLRLPRLLYIYVEVVVWVRTLSTHMWICCARCTDMLVCQPLWMRAAAGWKNTADKVITCKRTQLRNPDLTTARQSGWLELHLCLAVILCWRVSLCSIRQVFW